MQTANAVPMAFKDITSIILKRLNIRMISFKNFKQKSMHMQMKLASQHLELIRRIIK